MDSCELCKLRKVKCGKLDSPVSLYPSENLDQTESSQHVAGALAMSVFASTRKGRSRDCELGMGVNWRAGLIALKHSYMLKEPD